MLKAIIFDVDGTLAETEEWHRRAFNIAFVVEGYDWFWDRALYAELLKVTGGKERIRHFVAMHPVEPVSDAVVSRLHRRKNLLYARFVECGKVCLRSGILEVLAEARRAGLVLAIATTTSSANVDSLLGRAMGPAWRAQFSAVVSGESVIAKKPDPEVYERALNLLDIAAADAVAIEDSGIGLRAALAAGIKTICLRSQYCADDDLTGAMRVLGLGETLAFADIVQIETVNVP